MSQRLRLQAPAKINLHLRVGPPTADGFHPLLSWMCTVGLFDTLTIEPLDTGIRPSAKERSSDGLQPGRTQSPEGSDESDAPGSAGAVAPVVSTVVAKGVVPVDPQVRLTCDDATLPCDGKNLIVRAAVALAGVASGRLKTVFDIRAFLEKRIPMGAGLGGGSSDGATMLRGLNELWSTGFDRSVLAEIAAKLGSDIPFFCHGPSSICTGRGEVVKPTPAPTARWALLMLPDIHMPTPVVYRKFDDLQLGDRTTLDQQPDWIAWATLGAEQLLQLLVNDLESPAFAIRPDLADLRRQLEQAAGRIVRMSGSGSSLFTLYDSEAEARQASIDLSRKFGGRQRNQSVGQASEEASETIRIEVAELAPN